VCFFLLSFIFLHLPKELGSHPRIEQYQMATTVTDDGRLVFLYSVEKGICPKSYGMNVALMAGSKRLLFVLPLSFMANDLSMSFQQFQIVLFNVPTRLQRRSRSNHVLDYNKLALRHSPMSPPKLGSAWMRQHVK
jgi:hypothetical protein